jgi:hypothetical protein
VYNKGEGDVTEEELQASVIGLHLTRKPAMHLTRFGQPLKRWSQYSPSKTMPLAGDEGLSFLLWAFLPVFWGFLFCCGLSFLLWAFLF